MPVEAITSFIAVGIGFAVAGALVSFYQALTHAAPDFSLLERGPMRAALAVVPFLVFAAPFIIMRRTLRPAEEVAARRRFQVVMLATLVAGFWSLMSGTFVVMLAETLGLMQ